MAGKAKPLYTPPASVAATVGVALVIVNVVLLLAAV